MTSIPPVRGFTANWMLEPPVSTPTRRMQAKAASRICWYSTSDSVWAGATVIESPVWTPIGSKFSIEQTTTQLSALVAHHLELEFLPARDRPLDEDLANRAGREASGREAAELLRVGGDAGAGAAEDERGPDDEREADDGRHLERLVHVVREAGLGHREADLGHRLLEAVAVLGGADRLDLGPDELDPEPVEHAVLGELHREVERRLAAHRREQGVGALPLDDRREHVGLERLDVGAVGEVGIGHDRGGIRVRQDDPVTLLAQHPAGLGARVVELARLADDDRAGADDEDRRDVVAPAHQLAAMRARNSSNR